ncbi:MAG: DUF6575 domain-containing protein [Rheinheimera sp.]|nr:DUF6575 domain-containing protein [Rheinheimera sp.]
MLPTNTYLGSLKYYEIYCEFDGPKCFSLVNNLEQYFLVYWAGYKKDENKDHWFYVFVSKKILDALKRKEISVRDVYLNSDASPILIKTGLISKDPSNDFEFISTKYIKEKSIPPADFFVDPEEIVSVQKSSNWVFEINISKRAKKNEFPSGESVRNVLESFSELIESIMRSGTKEKPEIFPMSAVEGSFELKMGSTDADKTLNALVAVSDTISAGHNIIEVAKNNSLDPVKLKEFVDVINSSSVNLTIRPKTFSVLKKDIVLQASTTERTAVLLENATSMFISSALVPQANDIEKVIDVVEKRAQGEILHYENIHELSSERQVRYYTDAAYCLGLMKKNLSVTPAGYFLASRTDKTEKYQVLADRFESSEFGWAWMKYSKVNSMWDLDPNSAREFLLACVPCLSADTARRRATTLAKWLLILSKYRRKYETENCGSDLTSTEE